MTNEFNLTAPEPPAPLPIGERLQDWQQLVGHTIGAVIEDAQGKRGCDALIVTQTRCWLVLEAETGACGEAEVQIIGDCYYWSQSTIADYASPSQLLRVGIISDGEFDRLEAIRAEEKKKWAARRVHELRSELARIEGDNK